MLGLIAAVAALGVGVTLSPLASSNLKPHPNEAGDVALYRAEMERIRQGQGYYQAAAAELTARGFPTRSVFNWRTPLPIWLLGKLPLVDMGRFLLGGLALAAMLLAFESLSREPKGVAAPSSGPFPERSPFAGRRGASLVRRGVVQGIPVACALLLTGPFLPTILGDLFVVPVLWAGVFLALSVGAYGIDRPGWGVAFGLAAIFFRELALPYGVLCAGLALRQGRRREFAAWCLGLLAWLVFFGWHAWQVGGLMEAGARGHRNGWIQWGGAGFVISTAQMNAYLLLLPQWATALYLVAALVGAAGWSSPLGTRIGLSVCLFLTAFAVVGQSFNQYWGALTAPLLCFGVARFPASIGDLWRAANFSQTAPRFALR